MTEGNSGTRDAVFTITLSRAVATPVSVTFSTRDNEAFAPADFIGQNRLVTFAAGQTTATVAVPIVGDVIDESNELFTVVLTNPQGATLLRAEGNGRINDNDTTTISINDVTVAEGNSGSTLATFTVRLSTPSATPVTVNFATANGTATAGSDYVARTGTLTFAPGITSQAVNISITGDTLAEPDETFLVNLSAPTGATLVPIINDVLDERNETINLSLSTPTGAVLGVPSTAVLTILDNDATPTLSINDVTITEGDFGSQNAIFTLTLSSVSGQQVQVNFNTLNNTAVAPGDYFSRSGILIFPPGVRTCSLVIPVKGDTLNEANETFSVRLSAPVATLIPDNTGIGTIIDNDLPPSLSINDVRVLESNSGSTMAIFTVRLSTASGQQVTVNATTANSTAMAGSDYTATARTRTFAPGVLTQTFAMPVLADALNEPSETFFVNLSTPVNATVARARGVGTIDNTPPVPVGPLDITPQVGITPGGVVPYPYLPGLFRPTRFRQIVTLRNTSGAPIIGPATAFLTHLGSGITLTNANGTTIALRPVGSPYVNLNIVADNVWTPGETVTVVLDFAAPSSNISYSLLTYAGAGVR